MIIQILNKSITTENKEVKNEIIEKIKKIQTAKKEEKITLII